MRLGDPEHPRYRPRDRIDSALLTTGRGRDRGQTPFSYHANSHPAGSLSSASLFLSVYQRKTMATLPPGWAADYDGRRWFYQYTATGQVQYHFPTPGDEFPDFAGFFGGSSSGGPGGMEPAAELLPEERLESERQVRRRDTLENNGGGSRSSSSNVVVTNSGGARRKTAERDQCNSSTAALGDDGDGDEGGGGTCSFESFGYLGPGGYEGSGEVSPPTTVRGSVHGHAQSEGSLALTGGVSSLTPPPSAGVVGTLSPQPAGGARNGGQAEGEEGRHKHPPPPLLPAKIRLTPTGADRSTPSRAGDDNDGGQRGPSPSFEIPMLDGRAIPRTSPVGRVAELASASTARCAEEVNPAPVELPDSGASWLEPVPVPNLVNQYPVELPTGAREDGPVPPNAPAAGGAAGGRAGPQAQARPQPAPRPTVADYCSGPPPQRGQAPRVPPKIAHDGENDEDKDNDDDERLHQEILDFFPEGNQVPRALQIGVQKLAAEAEARRKSMFSERRLGPVPSILRPGPRRSSQPPMAAPRAATGTHATSPSSPTSPSSRPSEVTYQAFRPARPPKVSGAGAGGGRTQSSPDVDRPYASSERAREQQHHHHQQPGTAVAATVMGRPHAQSVSAPHCGPCPQHPDVAVMPDPSDHVSPAPFLSRSSTFPAPGEIAPTSSSSSSPSLAQPAVSRPVRSSMDLASGGVRLVMPIGTAQHHEQHSHESSPIASTTDTSPKTARYHSDGGMTVGSLSPGATEPDSLTGNTTQPSIPAPGVEEGTPPSIPSRPTSFSQSPGTGSSDSNFKNILRRVTRFGDAGAEGAQPALVMNGPVAGKSHMEYIPPKGKKEEVADWSWGHAK